MCTIIISTRVVVCTVYRWLGDKFMRLMQYVMISITFKLSIDLIYTHNSKQYVQYVRTVCTVHNLYKHIPSVYCT